MTKNRRGSYIAEAAIVLPFIILSVITCMLIAMQFYDSVSQQCEKHRTERVETVDDGVSYVREYQLKKRLLNDEHE